MKYLVFSDSHGETKLMHNIVKNACLDDSPPEGIIFLGDCLNDIQKIQRDFPNFTYHIVAGNCDFMSPAPVEKLLDFDNTKILITHGHRYGVKSGHDRILTAALQMGADAAFFGHSHIPIILQKNSITLLNPGSITEPRGGQARESYAVVEIIGGKILPRIIEV
ncbi:MAG: YfcE family phosphodiesterase [Defluviitaleaceae bacterium]|nr:YfcE family phosphodiesterase [Defluviitaleaceae bacterium]